MKTSIFQELYKENRNLRLVNAAIFSQVYSDESVLVKDLIYPEYSVLNKSTRFINLTRKYNTNLDVFANAFWKLANEIENQDFRDFLIGLNKQNSISTMDVTNGNGVSVYFPYSQQFPPEDPNGGGYYAPITTLTTATAEADEGWGTLPYYINGVFQYNLQVIVNDDFAYYNPTHIIGVNGIEPYGGDATFEAPLPPPAPPGVSRVYIGEGVCFINYDKLFSTNGNGGGSEIKFNRLGGYLQPTNGQITNFQDVVSVKFSRRDTRNDTWKRIYGLWHPDWVPNDNEQVLAIYEEDNTSTQTFTGSLGTTLTITPGNTITGSIGYSVTIQSQDEIIRQLKISRHSYFAGAFQNQGSGFRTDDTFLPLPFTHGWPIYDGGADVAYSWPYNTY